MSFESDRIGFFVPIRGYNVFQPPQLAKGEGLLVEFVTVKLKFP